MITRSEITIKEITIENATLNYNWPFFVNEYQNIPLYYYDILWVTMDLIVLINWVPSKLKEI